MDNETKAKVQEVIARLQALVDDATENDQGTIDEVDASDLELVLLYVADLEEGRA